MILLNSVGMSQELIPPDQVVYPVISGTNPLATVGLVSKDPQTASAPTQLSPSGGFGGYLPPVQISPNDRLSKMTEKAKSLYQNFTTALKKKRVGLSQTNTNQATGNPSRQPRQDSPQPYRSVLTTPPTNFRSEAINTPGIAYAGGGNAQSFGAGVRPVSMQEPLGKPVDDSNTLPIQFYDPPELPLESTEINRPASLAVDWEQDAGPRTAKRAQPISVLKMVDEAGDAPRPPRWELQKVSTELVAPLNSRPGQTQDSSKNNELRQNRDEQRLESDEGDIELRLLDQDQFSDADQALQNQSCADFRKKLLDNPITTIGLNISPPGSSRSGESLTRVWTNNYGEVLATGALVGLSRGYAIIDTDRGQQRFAVARLNDADWAAIAEQWRVPVECGIGGGDTVERFWEPQTFTWTASSLCHKPLYFQNIQLERYGHSAGPILQPVQSTVHFFRSYITLPFSMALNPPSECQYALGYYRPGNCAPWLVPPVPFNVFDKCFYQPAANEWSW